MRVRRADAQAQTVIFSSSSEDRCRHRAKHSGAILRKALMMFKPDMTPNEISYDSVRSYDPPVRHDTRVEYKCTTIQFTKFAKVILSAHPHFFTFSKLQEKGNYQFPRP